MKIIFYTTSTLSDVQEVNSMCISHYFNEYKHTVIDMNTDGLLYGTNG